MPAAYRRQTQQTSTSTIPTTTFHDILSKRNKTDQLEQLDDIDCYSSAWSAALFKYDQREQKQQKQNSTFRNISSFKTMNVEIIREK